MKHFRFILTLLALLLIISSAILASCDGDEEVTTELIGIGITESPDTAPETTEVPQTTSTPETTDEVTTAAPETTEPVVTEPPHVHSFGAWNTVKAASCTEEGLSERICSCGQKETQIISKAGHKAGEWIVDRDSTETMEGSKHQACTVCGATVNTEVIPFKPHVHSFGEWNTVKVASCTEEGLTERACSCGEKETMPTAKADHRISEWIIDKEASATTEGSKHQECTVCGLTVKTEIIPVTPHIPGEWVVSKEATCTDEGLKNRVCTKCGEIADTEVIPAKGHTEVIDPAKDATCTETGLTEGTHCLVCNVVIKAQKTVAVKEHTEVIDPAKDATCTETGLTEGTHCLVCNVVIKAQQTVAAKGHTEVVDAAKAATCTENGITEGKHCSVCNEILTAQQTIAAKGHTEVVDPAKAATCTESGLTEGKHCSVCNAVIIAQQTIAAKGHTEVVDPAKAATCTESGITEGKHCSVCNTVITAQKTISAKGHTVVIEPAKAATCTESGLTEGKHCSVCNTVITAQNTVPAKGHNEKVVPAKAATCTASGLTEGRTCIVCYVTLVAQQTVPATGHTDGEWIVDKEATLTSTGSKRQVCSVCGDTIKTEIIPVIEPAKAEYTVTVLNGSGTPVSGIKVSFMKGSSVVAEVTTDKDGKATVKLVEGEYEACADVEGYASAAVMLGKDNTVATLLLVEYAQNPEYIYPDEVNGVYRVNLGSVRVPVAKDEMRYFFFTPAEGAKYKFYTDSDKVEVGYYGGTFYVSETNTGEMDENGAMRLSVLHSQVGNTLVIGLKSTSSAVTECTLTIVRESDMPISDAERLWEQYQLSKTPEKAPATSGSRHYVEIIADVSNIFNPTGAVEEIVVVYNEKDGYYHLHTADGPVLYVMINNATVFHEALITIANVTNIGRYFYDEEGNFLKKESYNDAIIAYGAAANANGVVPLDDELIYILKNMGVGSWYDILSMDSIFVEEEVFVYEYNAWLFAVCYFS